MASMAPYRTAILLVLSSLLLAQEPHVHTSRKDARLLPLPKDEDSWHFVIFGDRTTGPPEGLGVLAQAVEDTNLLDPDLVMTVGDLVQGYNDRAAWMKEMEEYRAIMKPLRCRWFPVPGNHDIYWRGENIPKEEHEGDYEKHFGPLWYWFRHKNAAFVVLYSDEPDPATSRRSFGRNGYNHFSKEQLAWLAQALGDTKEIPFVFVFLHHPRWITENYRDSNWSEVHKLLKGAGNVRAVFAGHIHHMRYDGDKDGIEYFTLGATGGEFPFDVPKAGYLHHFNVVTVRPGGISIAGIPVGAVLDPREMTPERLEDVRALCSAADPVPEAPLLLDPGSEVDGAYRIRIANPSGRPVEITLSADPHRDFELVPDHLHRTLAPGKDAVLEFACRGRYREHAGPFVPPRLRLAQDYLGDGVRISIPERVLPLLVAPTEAALLRESAEHRELVLGDGKSCAEIPGNKVVIPDGPFTVELRAKSGSWSGRRPLLARTESSEWGIFATDGKPSFSVHLGGRYVHVESEGTIEPGVWHHFAGVVDKDEVRLYVDGKAVARAKVTTLERTRNKLPVFVGADPNRSGRPADFLVGSIDDVRISTGARYGADAFVPSRAFDPDAETLVLLRFDREIAGVSPDLGPARAHARLIGTAHCAPSAAPAEQDR